MQLSFIKNFIGEIFLIVYVYLNKVVYTTKSKFKIQHWIRENFIFLEPFKI